MNNNPFFFPNLSSQNNNDNPFLNILQNSPFLNNLQQPQPQPQPPLNNIFQDMFSGMVDKNMVNSVFANLISSKVYRVKSRSISSVTLCFK